MPNRTDSDANAKIGRMLQNARESYNITQQEMADAIDISKNHISAIERGQNKASISMLLGYCKKLGVTPNDVLGFADKDILPELKKLTDSMSLEEQRKFYKMGLLLKS